MTAAQSQGCASFIQLTPQFLACTLNALNTLGPAASINVPGVTNAINVLGATVVTRRNDSLLRLDVGLDRQIDLLMGGDASNGGGWGNAYGLGAAALAGEQPYMLGVRPRSNTPNSPAINVWADGYVSRFHDDTGPFESHGHTGVFYVGVDYLLAPYLVIGALVQFDHTEQTFEALPSHGSDNGWMAGPYATVRLSPNLFFQARAAWGKSDDTIGLDQSHTDHFDADRWLVRGTLVGQWRLGAWQFRPRVSVGYVEEDVQGYTSSLNVLIPSQTVSLGQAKAGPEFAYRYRAADGTVIEPTVSLEGIWNFEQSAGALKLDDLVAGDKVRGKAEAGLTILTIDGWSFGASVSYDGIGSGDYHAIGGRVRARLQFN